MNNSLDIGIGYVFLLRQSVMTLFSFRRKVMRFLVTYIFAFVTFQVAGCLKQNTDDLVASDAGADTDTDTDTDADTDTSTDGEIVRECDMVSQDCPTDQKCNAVLKGFMDSPFGGTRCVPNNVEIGYGPGDVCFNMPDGSDTCGATSMCIQAGTGEGGCFEFCQMKSGLPTCRDGYQCLNIDEVIPVSLCFFECDPLEQECSYGEGFVDEPLVTDVIGCFPSGGTFGCFPWRMTGGGVYGEPCEGPANCDKGLWCAQPKDVPGCEGDVGCCSAFCNALEDNACPDAASGQSCVAYYEKGSAPAGKEHIGLCQSELKK
jgi:hypothetical protein